MAFYPAIEYHVPRALSLPWAWDHDMEKTYGSMCHHYCPSEAYAKMHLQPVRRHSSLVGRKGFADVEVDNHKFVVRVDVQHFSPDELLVHFTSNNHLIIEGKHEEKQDEHGYITRSFKRRYEVPADISEDDMICSMSSDGILTVHVPRALPKPEGVKKTIPIVQTNKPAAAGAAAVAAPAPAK